MAKRKSEGYKGYNIDKALIFVWPILAALLSLAFEANYLSLIILFYGIPSVFLSFRNRHLVKKALLFSVVFGLPMTIITDYIAHLTRAWYITNTMFSFRLFGFSAVESYVWGVLIVYFAVMYYEYFLEHKLKDKLYYPNLKYIIIAVFALLLVFFFLLIANPSYLNITYSFFKLGIVLLLFPAVAVLARFPNLLSKFLKAGIYFFFFTFILEITALQLGLWSFEGGQFIGWVNIGGVSFPLEELIFWMGLTVIGLLSYYELFDDDMK